MKRQTPADPPFGVDRETGEIVADTLRQRAEDYVPPVPLSSQQLVLPTFDGLDLAMGYELRFGGKTTLYLGLELDDDLVAKCKLGARLRFTVDATVTDRAFKRDPLTNKAAAAAKLTVEAVDLESVEVRE